MNTDMPDAVDLLTKHIKTMKRDEENAQKVLDLKIKNANEETDSEPMNLKHKNPRYDRTSKLVEEWLHAENTYI